MAWNEPGGGQQDPWGGGGRNDQGPPDLDEVVRNLQNKMGGLFGGSGDSGAGTGSSGGGVGLSLILVIGLLVWLATGIYIVDEGKRGVVLQFGAYTETTMPGPHWHVPFPVQSVELVDVENQRIAEIGYRTGGTRQSGGSVPREALMLTEDENIVDVQLAVQYQVKDARNYLFNVADPDLTLRQATESALRDVVGKNKMDYVIGDGRAEVVSRVKVSLQKILDDYESGVAITSVNLQEARPPQEVRAAFDDAIKAREDQVRLKNEAEAYAREVVPVARGEAARALEEADAYKAQVIAEAEGDVARFDQLLAEYAKAPEVTRERLYLDAMESVLNNTNKVMVDAEGGNNLMYLPLDKMIGSGSSSQAVTNSAPLNRGNVGSSFNSGRTDTRLRDTDRGRRAR